MCRFRLAVILLLGGLMAGRAQNPPLPVSRQVNVNAAGQNIPNDAANEPSMCIDPLNPRRMAVGWRQFTNINNNFRQAGYGYTTNGGLNWSFGGTLETNIFRSDPVLASDASGQFYYLSLQITPTFRNDLWTSTNGGASWRRIAGAVGGDKAWMTIDQTASPGRGNIYQCWSTAANVYTNRIFSRSTDGGTNWLDPIAQPQTPFWSTLDVGTNGELCLLGWNGSGFWFNRSRNATNPAVTPTFDLTTSVNLGGSLVFQAAPVNPDGLLGQPWIAVDKSSGPTRGNIYALCSVSGTGNPLDVMFARSTNGGSTWSAPMRLNTDSATQNAWHWFGTLAVAPNGRIDVCWNDTRSNPNSLFSELYYTSSTNGGVTWTTNRPISQPFNHTLGYPMQQKMGDYIQMISLDDAACIAYTATFNGEQDVWFVSVDQPIVTTIARNAGGVRLSWNAVAGRNYCVQVKTNLLTPWAMSMNLGCVTATNTLGSLDDPSFSGSMQRFYRVGRQP